MEFDSGEPDRAAIRAALNETARPGDRDLAAAILDLQDDALFACDRHRCLIYLNASATTLLNSGRVVTCVKGRVGLIGCATARLDQALSSAIDSGSIVCIPLSNRCANFIARIECEPRHRLGLISVRDTVAAAEGRVRRARVLYAFTAAEAKLAASLLAGRTLEEHAQAVGIRTSTARTQLAAILAKTGARRQAEVVSRLTIDPPDLWRDGGNRVAP